jgi:predicted enzyme related to lactoylglutathione lyase
MKSNMIGWFEIPVTEMDRAVQFYNAVFQIKITVHDLDNLVMGWFPSPENSEAKGASGSLVLNKEHYKPSKEGALLYFTSQSGDINDELSRIEKAGGKIIQAKTQISENHGYMAIFIDTEGNRLALHSIM